IELVTPEDEPFLFLLRGGDIDSGSFSFYYEGDRLAVDPTTGSVLWEPGQEDVGTNDFTLFIRDTEGAESALLLRIVVIGIDDPPHFLDVPDVTLLVGETWSFQLNVSDEEGGTLSFGSNSSFVWVEEDGVLHVNGSQEFLGLNHVRVSISDGVNTVYILFNVSIIGEGPDGNGSDSNIDIQSILGGIGIAIALISLLFLLFFFLRRSAADRQVVMELEEADAAYDSDLASLDDGEALMPEDEG
ncbi:MAG: hypothetical protein ACMUFK_02445, partial [Thermoplasmatota archaeon]